VDLLPRHDVKFNVAAHSTLAAVMEPDKVLERKSRIRQRRAKQVKQRLP